MVVVVSQRDGVVGLRQAVGELGGIGFGDGVISETLWG